jgi:hypothetical protein
MNDSSAGSAPQIASTRGASMIERERHDDHGEHVRDRQQDVLHKNEAEPWKSFSTASKCRRSVRNRIK